MKNAISAREINSHLSSMTTYCYVRRADGSAFRISRARSRKGILEGRVINGSQKEWEMIPSGTVSHERNELWITAHA